MWQYPFCPITKRMYISLQNRYTSSKIMISKCTACAPMPIWKLIIYKNIDAYLVLMASNDLMGLWSKAQWSSCTKTPVLCTLLFCHNKMKYLENLSLKWLKIFKTKLCMMISSAVCILTTEVKLSYTWIPV